MAGVTLAQACGLDPPYDLLGREPEDRRAQIKQFLLRPDALQGLGCFPADVEHYSLGLGVGFGPAHLQEGGAVIPQLHVGPGERRGLGAPEQPVSEKG